ncbi:ATPase, P-type, ATPase-associated region domain protein, partial [mine drainage metagenome]
IEVCNVRKAQISIQSLHNMVSAKSLVLRDSSLLEIAASLIVPDDIVYLTTGNRVPADGIVISSSGLDIDESPMTGESYPVHKICYKEADGGSSGANIHRVVSGTLVVQGNGKFAVTATGLKTEMGMISESVKGDEEP